MSVNRAIPPEAHDPRDFSIEAQGVRLAARDYGGNGPRLILLNGLGENLTTWWRLVPHLTDEFHVIAYEHRDHGLSGSGTEGSFATLVDDVREVVRCVAPDGALLHGHSLGGLVALSYAASGGSCAAVIVEDTGAPHPIADSMVDGLDANDSADAPALRWATRLIELQERLLSGRARVPEFEEFFVLLRAHWDENGRDTTGAWAHEWTAFEKETRRRFARGPDATGVLSLHPSGESAKKLKREALELIGGPVVELYGRIPVPVRVVFGDDSRAGSLEAKQRFAADASSLSQSLHVSFVKDAGHFVHKDQPDKLAAIIRDVRHVRA